MHRTAALILTIAVCALILAVGCADDTQQPQAPPPADTPPAGQPQTPTALAQPVPTAEQSTPQGDQTPTASTPSTTAPPATAFPTPRPTLPPKPGILHPELDSTLNHLLTDMQAGASPEETAAQAPLHRGDSVGVTIQTLDTAAVLSFLEQHGVSPRHAGDDWIEVFVPVSLLPPLAQLDATLSVSAIIPPHAPTQPRIQPRNQRIEGDGPKAHGSTLWNRAGFTGSGIKVGIIDVGFDGASDLLGTELPPTVEARCYVTDTDRPQGLSNCGDDPHGTDVAEAVMDIAPEASLYLASTRSNGDLAEIVRWMSTQGVSVINMSLGWQFDGYGDGSSPFPNSPLNTLDEAVARGIVWISAAGNSGEASWLGTPADTDGDGLLEFGDAGESLSLINTYGTFIVQLRWHGRWGGEDIDLELHIHDAQGNIVAHSLNEQSGDPTHVPLEILSAEAQGAATIQVTSRSGQVPAWLQVVVWRGAIAETTGSGSILSPAESASRGMLTVGAAHWENLSEAQPYSSRGPTPDGRPKPDIIGADCGQFSAGTFCGTSQASPHVAALAALVRQRYPDQTPQEVVGYLKEHAHRHAENLPQNTWGAGLATLPPPPAPTPTPMPTATPTPMPTPTLTPTMGIYDAERAQFFRELDYAEFGRDGYYFDWMEEGEIIRVMVGPRKTEDVLCEQSVVGNSLSQNPTLNDYSHAVYVFVERQMGWHGCAGFSKHDDLNNWERETLVGFAANEWRVETENMDEPLEFLTDEKRAAGSYDYSRPPLGVVQSAGFGIEGADLICGPDELPMAIWNDQNGFYKVSEQDKHALYNYNIIGPGTTEHAINSGWFFVLPYASSDAYPSYCWRVPNWTQVPVRPCPACQRGLR